jgi:hypothetical protein
MSNSSTSNQHDKDGDCRVRTDKSADAAMLLVPSVSCWEAWRWEVARAMLRGSSTSFMTLGESQMIQPKSRQER